MNVFIIIFMSKPALSKKNISPMEIPRDFPCALSHKKMGKKTTVPELSPPSKYLKVDRYGFYRPQNDHYFNKKRIVDTDVVNDVTSTC